ncbi:MAG: hypothetical protein ABIN99_10390 [Nitrosospira sp.]
MRLRHQFEYFDPLAGELTDPYAVMFFEAIHRARSLLKGRTSEFIKTGASVINRIYHDPNFVDPMYQAFEQEPIKTRMFGQAIDVIPSINDVEALYQNIGNVLLAEYREFPDAQWHELFAVLALSYAEKVCSEVHNQATWPPNHFLPKITDSHINDVAQEYLGLAMQAITYAENLRNQEATVKSTVQQVISDQKREAVNKRHAKKTGPLKNEVLRLYFEKYTKRSNRDAASRILKELTDTGAIRVEPNTLFFGQEPALNTDEPENRIEKWIGQAKKKHP